MSVAAQNVSQSVAAFGGQTVFVFNFRCDDVTTLRVYANDVLQNAPAVALNADQIAAPGGTVTIAAQAGGVIVTVERDSAITQTTAFGAYQPFPSSAVGVSLDRVVMLIQEAWSYITRAMRMTRANMAKVSTTDLPAPLNGSALGWVDAGGGLSKLGNVGGGSAGGFTALGELLTDTGDHTHYTSVSAPVGPTVMWFNNGRLFPGDDYNVAGNVWTLTAPVGALDKLHGDYNH